MLYDTTDRGIDKDKLILEPYNNNAGLELDVIPWIHLRATFTPPLVNQTLGDVFAVTP